MEPFLHDFVPEEAGTGSVSPVVVRESSAINAGVSRIFAVLYKSRRIPFFSEGACRSNAGSWALLLCSVP